MANGENDLTDEERLRITRRIGALAITIERSAAEVRELTAALGEPKKREAKEVDEFGDPTYAFKVKVAIPKDIKLTRKMRTYAGEHGFNANQIARMWTDFTEYYGRTGTKWLNWSLVWQKWVRSQKDREKLSGGSSRDLKEL